MPIRLNSPLRPLEPAAEWIGGGPVRVEALCGRPALIHFWAASCGACKEQLPQLREWSERYWGRLGVVSVHTPVHADDLDLAFVAEQARGLALPHPVVLDTKAGEIADAYDVHFTPSYFLFDRAGRLRHYQAGYGAAPGVMQALERLVGGVGPEGAHPVGA
jgi:thiol-disulfide isomerase/thioredoxin